MADKGERIEVPKFKTEAEEAQWWYDNRDKVEQALIAAMDNGTIRRGTAQRLTSEARASRNVTIRMAEADLDLARWLLKKGIVSTPSSPGRPARGKCYHDAAAGQ
jgi:hypothetical protein